MFECIIIDSYWGKRVIEEEQKAVVDFFLEKGFILSPDLFDMGVNKVNKETEIQKREDILFLSNHVMSFLQQKKVSVNFKEMEKARALFEKGMNRSIYETFLNILKEQPKITPPSPTQTLTSTQIQPTTETAPPTQPDVQEENKVEESKKEELSQIGADLVNDTSIEIITTYDKEPQKREFQDFVKYFNKRFDAIEGILRNRQELARVSSINKIKGKTEREESALIGIVSEKRETKNGNIILKVEDKTSSINILISKNKPDLFNAAKDIVLDEIIGIVGTADKTIVFASNIIWPDIPLYNELKKSPEEEYAIFISDIHVGHNMFLKDDFEKFLKWLNGEVGNDQQKELVKKIKYVFVLGDLVDGVGIYPNQDKEQNITDIYKQYEEVTRLLDRIPKHMKLIIIPGNHDALRLAEPQPIFDRDVSASLYTLKNAIITSNPSIVTIGKTEAFPGFSILLYHGYSFDHYIANVDSIRNNGGYDRADLVMKFLLKRRHLSPTHGGCPYIPDSEEDPLVIKKIPDFFATGHIHKTSVANYRNITLISGSCWQSKTAFQEKVGHHPEPSRVPLINLQTREVKILKFGDN